MKKLTLLYLVIFMFSCKQHGTVNDEKPSLVSVKTVTVKQGNIENKISLNGKTVYLERNTIVAPIAGYIVKTNVKFGDKVQKNEILFEIQTKESKALENTEIIALKSGIVKVLASFSGIINELNITEAGGYIAEGSPLCNIVVNDNLLVQVNVPFEYNSLLKPGTKCILILPDNTRVAGAVSQILPFMDETNQTQNILIKPMSNRQLPENLSLIVQFVTDKHLLSCLVPREAMMTNETQSEFWVMKIVKDSVAIKIPIVKGIENDSIVEVLSADLTKDDWIISEGAYGLPDSTVVRIIK